MKISPSENGIFGNIPRGLLALLVLLPWSTHPAAAQDAASRQSEAYQASVAQDGLRRDAEAVRNELSELREQIRQLSPGDLPVIDRAIGQMDSLSRDEMERTIQALRGASRPDAAAGSTGRLASALKDQGTIGLTLKRLAVALDARQSMEGISAEVSALLARQVATRDEIARLARIQQLPRDLHNRHEQRYLVAEQDQKTITEDLKLLAQRITGLSQTLEGDAQQNYLKAAAALRDGKIGETADRAAGLVGQGPMGQAAAAQTQVADTLIQVEQALAGNVPLSERLASLSERLKSTLEEEKSIAATVAAIGERTSVKQETYHAQDQVSNQASVLRAELQALNAKAAADLQTAVDASDRSVLNFDRMWEERLTAQENTRREADSLADAAKALDAQIAALPAQTPATPADLAKDLDALQRDTAKTATAEQAQAASGKPADPAAQQAMNDQIAALQARALPVAPDAANALSAAAQAAQNPDATSQAEAARDLARAADLLAQQESALTGRSAAQQALANAESQAQQAAQALAQVQPELGSNQTSADAVNQLNAVKADARQALQAAAKAGAPPEAMNALAQATRALDQAQQDAAQTNLPQAQADAKAAQQALTNAQQAMANAGQAMAAKAAGPAMAAKAGHDPGQRQNGPGTPQGQGNGGGGQSGDNLAGAGSTAVVPVEPVNGMTPQERAAVAQLQREKPPAEFAPEVQQYYKNIADGAGL